tara:strand:- start:284 stop:682 length:399 start_codon:yes stop_codon:yes gene_type:complete
MLKAQIKKKSLKINIIPLIDIIFLMLVFFMLATNFNKNQLISFSINNQKQALEDSTKEKLMIIFLKKNEIVFQDKKIELDELERQYLKKWNSLEFDKIVILNDKESDIQILISVLDIIKKNRIKNVNFSDEP